MKSSRAASLAWLLAAPTLLGCSLMGLDDFRQQRCRSEADCVPAQTAFGDAERCDFYVCRQGACVPQHGTETCNGKDDDCNGFIDDGIAVAPHELIGTSSSDAVIAYAFNPSGAPTAYVVGGAHVDGERSMHITVVSGTDPQPAQPLVYASAAMEPPERPCPAKTVSAGVGASDCWFDDVALGADQEQLVYATINTVGCSKGQLRVGLALASEPFRVWLGSSPAGTAARSNIEVGVDVGDGSSCSGNSGLDENGEAAGARSPAVAVLDASPNGAGALVTWLAAASSAVPLASCETPVDVPVQALAVMVPEEARDAGQSWLVGSNEGIPISIGQSSSLRPPAVVGLEAQGGSGRYLVAFPSTTDGADGIALVFVTLEGAHVRIEERSFIADDRPDLVALANSTSDGNVALAWRSGCGPTSELKLALLSATGNAFDGYPLSLGTGNIVSRPQLLHSSDGFTTHGKRGGWYVSWSESLEHSVGRTRVARLADEPSPLLPEVFTVTSGALGFPLLFPGEDSTANHGLVTMMSAETPVIRVFPNWCH
jgi:hypothetical protein